MGIKLLGAIKIFIGLGLLIIAIIVILPLIRQNLENTYLMIGNIFGLIVLEFYGLYCIYSGWTEFQNGSNVKKGIIWAGVIVSLFLCLLMLWLIINDSSNSMGVGGYILLGLFLLIGTRDGSKIKKLGTTTLKL